VVLIERLLHAGTRRPHVFVVPVPGYRPVRWAAERHLLSTGWPQAVSPAEADVLLVCGDAEEQILSAADIAWDAMPGPRARVVATDPQDVPAVLSAAREQLRDLAAQRVDAHERPAPPLGPANLSDSAV
jgi:hypothetical protein